MRKRDRRPKAQETHQREKFDLGEAFPTVETASIAVTTETGHGLRHEPTPRSLGGPILPEYFDCSGPLCHGGGFSVREVLRQAVSQGLTKSEGSASCIGREASAGGRKIYNYCNHFFQYVVSIIYRVKS